MNQTSPHNNSHATRREWVGLAVLALPCILASMDLTVLNLAVAHLSMDLQPSSHQLLWIVDIYGFMIAGALITMGTLGDRVGRRRMLLIGAAAFGLVSLLAAFSKTTAMLITARALLGLAGATLAPSTLSLIRNMFVNDKERTVAIGIWATCFSLGAAMGPLLGGILLEHFWWGSVFLLNVPVMALLLVVGPWLLPEFRDPNAGRMDILSAAMSLTAVLPAIYGLKMIAEFGFAASPIASIAFGIIMGGLFLRRQYRLENPLIDLKLFRSPAFSVSLALNLLGCVVAFGIFLFIAQHLQLVLGFSPLQAGLWSMPSSLGFLMGSMLSPQLVRRLRPAFVIAAGLMLATGGFMLLATVNPASDMTLLATAIFLYSLGISPIFTLGTDLILNSAPPERAGAASSLSETASELGGALGLAILGSVGMAAYRLRMAPFIPSALSLPSAAAARGTLGGAIAAAQELPPELSAQLLIHARQTFDQAFALTAGICSVVTVVMAILAIAALKGRPAAETTAAEMINKS